MPTEKITTGHALQWSIQRRVRGKTECHVVTDSTLHPTRDYTINGELVLSISRRDRITQYRREDTTLIPALVRIARYGDPDPAPNSTCITHF